MKIQDIFKLNLNDRGGVKLFNKIMGRYNIPKADSKELINEVQNSSSGDGGVKEYYYRVDDEIPAESRDILTFLLNMVLVSSALISDTVDNFTTCYKVTNVTNRDASGAALSNLSSLMRAFSYLDTDTYFSSYGMDKAIILSGNIFDKFLQYGGVEAEAILQTIEPYLKEITKEEYESLITYKP